MLSWDLHMDSTTQFVKESILSFMGSLYNKNVSSFWRMDKSFEGRIEYYKNMGVLNLWLNKGSTIKNEVLYRGTSDPLTGLYQKKKIVIQNSVKQLTWSDLTLYNRILLNSVKSSSALFKLTSMQPVTDW